MAYYRRAKLAVDTIRNASRITTPRAPIQDSASRIYQHGSSNPAKFSGSYPHYSVSQRLGLGLQMGARRIHCFNHVNNRFLSSSGSKRFYYVDRHRLHHFRQRGPTRWFQNPRTVLIVVLIGSGVFITVYFGHLETVPYTKRKHFVLLSIDMEKRLGDTQFQQIKAGYKGKILPALHPDSIRVRLIAQDVIEALQRGLKREEILWGSLGYASPDTHMVHQENVDETLKALSEGEENVNWHKDDEILDDKWVHQSRKKGQEKGAKADASHLDGLKWEVLVVKEPIVNAFCLPGGKIVVFMGLLEHFKTDAEIATVLAHEIGHAVARHGAETITKNLWFTILQLILLQFIMPDLANAVSVLFLRLPFSRRMEMEADYIGLLLMASSGYDPRLAPSVYEKLGKLTGDSKMKDYISTHPSGKKRAQLLGEAQVMDEALSIYREREYLDVGSKVLFSSEVPYSNLFTRNQGLKLGAGFFLNA